MAVNPGDALHYALPFLLCLAGFHGCFFYAGLWKKTAAWCTFQGGLILFLIQLAPAGSALPHALAWAIAAATLGVGIFLCALNLKADREPRTPKRASK